ncbi:MAG: Fic family protein [Planctomycetes bacterium]|nr:Fic family protein [Planctomycetota bacterium]
MRMPQRPPNWDAILREAGKAERHLGILYPPAEIERPGEYIHWDKLRRKPTPGDLTHREWWAAIKFRRVPTMKRVPMRDKNGESFWYTQPDTVSQALHQIDLRAGGQIAIPHPVTDPEMRDSYIVRSLMEEAITSSQLEDAAVTREDAKEMIRSGRKPTDVHEKMILNNYFTMQHIRQQKEKVLTLEFVLELHRLVTKGTMKNPADEGRLRPPGRRIDVGDMYGQLFHDPPPAEELEERMRAMCDFANGKTPKEFMHPVVRAIILHFWLAYDHPFVDGNGRTARALFYWCMLHNKYWLCEFISISQIILKAPAKYGLAFLHTETDENDLTYFLFHQLDVVLRAIKQLSEYVERKTERADVLEREMRTVRFLNHRQRALVGHALRHARAVYTIESHRLSHAVVYQTARTDLLDLVERGILESWKQGREWHFKPAKDIEAKLQSDE